MATNEELVPILIPVPVRAGEMGDVRLRQYLATFEIQGVGSVDISLLNGGVGLVFDHGPYVALIDLADVAAEVLKMLGVEEKEVEGGPCPGDLTLRCVDQLLERKVFPDRDGLENAVREAWLDEFLDAATMGTEVVDAEGVIWDWWYEGDEDRLVFRIKVVPE